MTLLSVLAGRLLVRACNLVCLVATFSLRFVVFLFVFSVQVGGVVVFVKFLVHSHLRFFLCTFVLLLV